MECNAGQCNKISNPKGIFILTPSLKGWPTKTEEAPSPHEVRLTPLDTKPVFACLGGELTQLPVLRSFLLFNKTWSWNLEFTFYCIKIVIIKSYLPNPILKSFTRLHRKVKFDIIKEQILTHY